MYNFVKKIRKNFTEMHPHSSEEIFVVFIFADKCMTLTTSRYRPPKMPLAQRIYQLCNEVIEDETHALPKFLPAAYSGKNCTI